MIAVVNKYKHNPTLNDVLISRGTPLGNPYTSKPLAKTKALYQVATDIEAIEKYREHLEEKIRTKDKKVCDALNQIYLMAIKGDVNLVCYCKPKPCHGDVIKEIVEKKIIVKDV